MNIFEEINNAKKEVSDALYKSYGSGLVYGQGTGVAVLREAKLAEVSDTSGFLDNIFLFSIKKDIKCNYRNIVTERIMESGVKRTTHIVNTPNQYTLSGLVAELTKTVSIPERILSKIITTLEPANELLPSAISDPISEFYSQTEALANDAKTLFSKVNYALDKGASIYNLIAANTDIREVGRLVGLEAGKSEQTKAVEKLKAWRDNKTALVLETPYLIEKDVVIENLTVRQRVQNLSGTDIEIDLKQTLFADVPTISTEDVPPNLRNKKQVEFCEKLNSKAEASPAFLDESINYLDTRKIYFGDAIVN
jgi:hypothetical protein